MKITLINFEKVLGHAAAVPRHALARQHGLQSAGKIKVSPAEDCQGQQHYSAVTYTMDIKEHFQQGSMLSDFIILKHELNGSLQPHFLGMQSLVCVSLVPLRHAAACKL